MHAERAADLKSWAEAVYGRADVADACLTLQDQGGQNVPYLLWVAWAWLQERPLDAETLEAGSDTARAWEEAAVRPLRSLRQTLKAPIPDMGDLSRLAIREGAKALELEAERRLLLELDSLAPPPGAAGHLAPSLAAALADAARSWARVVPRPLLEALASKLLA